MKHRYLKINNIKSHILTWGNPRLPKLFLWHGWMDMGASFDFMAQVLSQQYYCIAPDMRGYGKSGHTTNPLGYFFYEYIADAKAIIDYFSPDEKIRLLGHSLGGGVAALYSGTYPDRVSHLINLEGFAFRETPIKEGPQRAYKWLESVGQNKFKVYANLGDIAMRLIKTNPNLKKSKALFLAKHLTKKVKGGYQIAADPKHKMLEPYPYHINDMAAFFKNITAKCLLVSGEKTEMARYYGDSLKKHHQAMKARIGLFPKKTKHVMIKNVGHMMHHEKPEQLAQLVLRFCQ